MLVVPILVVLAIHNFGRTPIAQHDTPALPSAPADVLVRIVNASAVEAEVRIDDGPYLPLPVVTTVPRDDREHTIYLRTLGRPVRVKKVSFKTDLVLVLSPLEPD